MTKKESNPVTEFDVQWKFAVEGMFQDFIKFFMTSLYEKIDFSVPPVSLDKEFQRLVYRKENQKGTLRNDKLMKVRLKNGKDHFILIHIEIQSQRDPDFPERMFKYFYRIRDKYQESVTAIAVYTDRNYPENYDHYVYDCEGTHLTYRFNAYRVT